MQDATEQDTENVAGGWQVWRSHSSKCNQTMDGKHFSVMGRPGPSNEDIFRRALTVIRVLSESACMSLDLETKKAHGVKKGPPIWKYTFAHLP